MDKSLLFTGDYIPLNREQRRMVDLLAPYDGDFDFFDKLESGKLGASFNPLRVTAVLGELERKGGVLVSKNAGKPFAFTLSTSVRDWRGSRRAHLLAKSAEYLLKLLSGASGGLVVWLLTRAFTPAP